MNDPGVFLTRAAEGLDRRGFTLADVEKMIEAGILDRDERFELIDGEIVPMSPQNMPHMLMRTRLAHWLRTRTPNGLEVIEDATVDLGAKLFLEADIVVAKVPKRAKHFRVKDLSLAVEIADTSRARDLFTKAPRYGAAGVPELWVVELNERVTYVFRGPGSEAWANPARVLFDGGLEALFLSGQSVLLAEFET